MHARWLASTLFSLILFLFCGCGGLPDDFASLPLQDQVTAYERHLQGGGRSLIEARSQISWHGRDAASLMAQYITGERPGLPRLEAIEVIHSVQLRGCDLAGTAAESALEGMLREGAISELERNAAVSALDSIHRGINVPPGQLDDLRGGPCEQEGRTPEHTSEAPGLPSAGPPSKQ